MKTEMLLIEIYFGLLAWLQYPHSQIFMVIPAKIYHLLNSQDKITLRWLYNKKVCLERMWGISEISELPD